MKWCTLVTTTVWNVSPSMIPKSRIKFEHATSNSGINSHNPPHKSSHPSGIIHHRTMGSEGSDMMVVTRKPRILCLHGFRTSGEIFRIQSKKWPESVLEKVELFFPDAPFPCNGKSEVEGIFDPPFYEWFQFSKEFTEYENFDKCLEYIEECMIKYAPIDGLLGFSQGAILAAALPGLQAKEMQIS
ncbi:rhodanese-like domain-containing protein 6 isoform X2 [Cynara cardunculus var. scolymus]|uniref:rhodanese-like domain-containing protein 6 isoform X2 n=1 Tax=Cynara cardunculus var. scolymus TaxID=59895 RepID=UPI000D628CD1|nr:rhodanese-like domain-containing protein 6 isoform X2 [Cynara cardunculus var. scolymus]